jgi:hypothetical protein
MLILCGDCGGYFPCRGDPAAMMRNGGGGGALGGGGGAPIAGSLELDLAPCIPGGGGAVGGGGAWEGLLEFLGRLLPSLELRCTGASQRSRPALGELGTPPRLLW